MNPSLAVLDTSVVVKWFVREDGTDKALDYLTRYASGEFVIVIPSLLPYEFVSVLWFKKREGITQETAALALKYLVELRIEEVDSNELLGPALEIAYKYNISPYDAVFIALAERLDCPFITADRGIWNRLKEVTARVKYL